MNIPLSGPADYHRPALPTFGPLPAGHVPAPGILYQNIAPDSLHNLRHITTDGNVRHEETTYGYYVRPLCQIFRPERFQARNPRCFGAIDSKLTLAPRLIRSTPFVPVPSVFSTLRLGLGVKTMMTTSRAVSLVQTMLLVDLTISLDGHEQEVLYPDFVVSKPVPQPDNRPRFKRFLVVIEIKTNSTCSVVQAIRRLMLYSARLAVMLNAHVPAGGCFPSYLIYGDTYTSLVLQNGRLVLRPWQYLFQQQNNVGGQASFLSVEMCELAVRHWNL